MKNLLLFLLAATLFACDKEKDETKFDLDEFFDKHQPKEQVFTVSGDSVYWKKIIADNGGVIEFNAGRFRDINNNPITDNVTMKVIEVYKTSDIILSGLHTVTYSYELLKSNGMLSIQFETNGQEVSAWTSMKISVPPVSNFFQGSDLFVLGPGPGSTIGPWMPGDSAGFVVDSCGGTTCSAVIQLYSAAILEDFKWINCDYPIDTPYTNIKVNVSAEDSIKHIRSYIVMKNVMGVTGSVNFSNDTLTFRNIPVAEPVIVIVIGSNTEGVVYSGIKEFIVSENIAVDVSMNPTTEEELLAAIRALD